MPRGDGTGPMGTWTNCSGRPALGRGAGRALGAGFGRGAGMGNGLGLGRGRGMGAGYVGAANVGYANPVAYSAADVKANLQDRATLLESELASIKAQLATSATTDVADSDDK